MQTRSTSHVFIQILSTRTLDPVTGNNLTKWLQRNNLKEILNGNGTSRRLDRLKNDNIHKNSLRSWRDARAGERQRSRHIPSRAMPARNSRAAKPRVKFPPATFGMVFACRPLLALLMSQLNKPIRERSI